MNRKPLIKSRLGLEMLFGVLGALLLSIGLLFAARWILYRYIEQHLQDESIMNKNAYLRLQEYVTENGISSADLSMLNDWRDAQHDQVLFFLFSNGHLVYDSTSPEGALSDLVAVDMEGGENAYSYPLRLTDASVRVAVYDLSYYGYYQIADGASYGLAFLTFAVLVIFLMRGKLRYIALMEDEIRILEGGDLSYRMTVRGKDELAELAQGIDSMRASILERQQGEAQAQKANRELIAAMSHDLRTPLTSLMGYLTLLNQGRYDDEKQFHHFLSVSQEKAQRIKELSDKLFQYFLVYARDAEDMETETVDAFQFLEQVLEDHIFELTSGGYTVEMDCPGFSAAMEAETDTLLRVFENLFGNIQKYADPAKPVEIRCEPWEREVSIAIKNAIRPDRERLEGTRIGLHTCESVVRRHGGTFCFREEDGFFSTVLTLPITRTH